MMNGTQNLADRITILIVDDISENRQLLAKLIKSELDCRIILTKNGPDAVKIFETKTGPLPSLILLDIMMPGMDGFETARKIKSNPKAQDIPILFITAMNTPEDKVMAFQAGGVDFISKPFNQQELLARVGAHLKIKTLNDQLREKNRLLKDKGLHLQALVEEKTRQIENMTLSVVSALENANLYNDTDTGHHLRRVARYSALIARKAGLADQLVEKIRLYAPLHDVGKVGIPDHILKKPGKYTAEEFEEMKRHVSIGGEMLGGGGFDPVARNIILYHHEKWNGQGYLEGLKGDAIPIEARVVALADVYDALTTARSYKEAYPDQKAVEIIKQQSREHFDPLVVKILLDNLDEFSKIRQK